MLFAIECPTTLNSIHKKNIYFKTYTKSETFTSECLENPEDLYSHKSKSLRSLTLN